MTDSIILNKAQMDTNITTSSSKKRKCPRLSPIVSHSATPTIFFLCPDKRNEVNSKDYVLLARPKATEKREQLSEWEDIEINEKGNANVRSIKSDVPDRQHSFVEPTIQMPKNSVGGSFFVVKPRSGTSGDEKVGNVDEQVVEKDEDREFVVL
jgi:hypothetical protein